MGGEALPDPSLFLSGPSLGGGKWNILYWAMWGLGSLGWRWCTLFPLDLKAQCGFGDQRLGTHPLRGPEFGRVVSGGEEQQEAACCHSA